MSDSGAASGASRHLGIEGVKKYVAAGVPGLLQVDGDPSGYLIIDPLGQRLAIQLPADGPVPNCARYENAKAARVRRDEADWNEFGVSAGDRLEDLYPLLCQVLDRVQLESQAFSAAVLDVLRIYRNVLAPRSGLSESDQIGLYGELLVLRHLVKAVGPESAVATWLGPSDEEHDFAFEDTDLEVKTTSGERRRHWISSATQLTPTEGKGLFLLSIQITGAGDHGMALPDLVNELAAQLGRQSRAFMAELERGGYLAEDAELYPKRWTLRTQPAAFAVDDAFPALQLDALGQAVPDISRIVELRYQLDLVGLPHAQLDVLDGFLGPQQETKA